MPSVKYTVANYAQPTRATAPVAWPFRRICDDSHRHAPEPTENGSLKRQAYFAKRPAASSMAMFATVSAANHTPSAEASMLT